MLLATFGNLLITYLISLFISSGGRFQSPTWLKDRTGIDFDYKVPIWSQISGALNNISPGQAKIIWSTTQIVATVAISVGVTFPEPMASFSSVLSSIVNMDFLNADCIQQGANYHTNVYIKSAFPLLLIIIIWASFPFRLLLYRNKYEPESYHDINFAMWRKDTLNSIYSQSLIVIYLFIPSVALSQFTGLDCTHLGGSTPVSFLRVDSSIDCNSKEHKQFVLLDLAMITVYVFIIFSYVILLYVHRERINPSAPSDGHQIKPIQLRDKDPSISHLRFLVSDLRCETWPHEVIDMIRRIFFIGIIPLISKQSTIKATVGSTAALLSTIYFRETSPFNDSLTNLLAYIAQWQVL